MSLGKLQKIENKFRKGVAAAMVVGAIAGSIFDVTAHAKTYTTTSKDAQMEVEITEHRAVVRTFYPLSDDVDYLVSGLSYQLYKTGKSGVQTTTYTYSDSGHQKEITTIDGRTRYRAIISKNFGTSYVSRVNAYGYVVFKKDPTISMQKTYSDLQW